MLSRVLIVGLSLLLAACGGNPLGIQFDYSVSGEQQAYMDMDMARLSGIEVNLNSTDMFYLGISQSTGAALQDYIAKRVRYIVGQNYSLARNTTLPNTSDSSSSNLSIFMINLGAHLYLEGKKASRIHQMTFNDNVLSATSPRVGFVQIGEIYFSENRIKGLPLDDKTSSILRLGTLVHEARHADGNGANAAFPHATCPYRDPSVYTEYPSNEKACDTYLNGSYAVQNIFLKGALYGCRDCTAAQYTGLQTYLTRNLQRQIGQSYADPTPERLQ